MNTTELKLVDNYFELLKDLSRKSKLELIEKLSNSIQSSKQNKDDSWKELFGSLKLAQSADEFIKELKEDRSYKAKTIPRP